MRKIKLILSLLAAFSAVTLGLAGFCFAWLTGATTDINITDLRGGVISQYFHCGDGSENDPFVITRPVHLYNMTELYDKLDGFAAENYHFQLGYDLDNDSDVELYEYNSEGIATGNYTDVLDMSRYTSLLPITPFGGSFNGSSLTIENLNIAGAGESDIGFFGYVSSTATIQDLYIDHITLNTNEAIATAHNHNNAYVGYLAGHIEDAKCFTNTYVNHCSIAGQSVLTKNEWGYFGHCENAAEIEEFIMRANGENAGWGGSVNMQKMYDRLYDIANNATTVNNYAFEKDIVTKVDGTTFERNALTGYAYTYRTQKEGSFVFSRYSTNAGPLSNYMYLNGGTRYHQYQWTETQVPGGFKISYNGHYLGVNGTTIADHEDAWIYQNNYLSIYIDGQRYYLTHNLTLSTTTQETWTRQNNTRLYYTTGGWFTTTTYHYITYNNGWVINTTTTRNSATQLTWTNSTYTRVDENSSGDDYMDYSGTNVTYFPLITNPDSYEVARKNTGYVIGGSEDNTPDAYPNKTGDIRVSKYSTDDISNSYSGGSLNTVYTINSNLRTDTINASDYAKYAESEASFLESITSGNIYGLHFMPANININHLVTADYTLINGEERTNYQMPASSIDFNVAEKGFINFFAGTYFSGNNSFFSLHHIERDAGNSISSIKEIAEIYKSNDDSKDYIYKYTDNSYTAPLTADYSLTFSTNRIKRTSNITTDAVYYFEIPVNAGEFALGSVDGGTGAYLMYLDIATNGGTDQQANVDTFGSIEYRSVPGVVENSILLITYEQAANQIFSIQTYYEDRKYYISTNNPDHIQVKVTILSTEYTYYYNGVTISNPAIQTYTFVS